jgi:hypothetical protein
MAKNVSWKEAVEQKIREYFTDKKAEFIRLQGEPEKVSTGGQTYLWAWKLRARSDDSDWGDEMYAFVITTRNNAYGCIVANLSAMLELASGIAAERLKEL